MWAIVALLTVPFYMFSQRELAPTEDQGFFFGIVQASANSTLDQTKLYTKAIYDVYRSLPESDSIFQITYPTAGFGGMTTKPWSERTKTTEQLVMETMGPLSQIPGIRVIPIVPPPLPGGGDFPVDFVIASAAEPQQLSDIANKLVQKAFASGMFIFADADLKFDQPQAEVVFDRDKVRSQGVNLSQAGLDLSTLLGGDYVNRFSIQGRSYKVIPQIKRAERLSPEQLTDIYVTGSGNQLVPLSTFATLQTTTQPRELKKFQQLNAVRIQGVIPPPVPLDQALRFLEDEARATLPQGFTIDYAGESRQLRTEGGRFLGTFLLSAILIYLVLAAQFESFRDPLIILAGSVPLAIAGALLFSFLGFTSLNIYSQVGLITLVGLVSKNGILIVQFANHLQETGRDKLAAIHRSVGHAAAPDPDDDRGDRGRAFPARARDRPWRRSAQQHRHHARDGHGHRNVLHTVRGAFDLHARGTHASRGGPATGLCAGVGHARNGDRNMKRALILYDWCVVLGVRRHLAQGARSAGQTLQLTVDEAVRRAVEHNPDLASVRFGTRVEAARCRRARAPTCRCFRQSSAPRPTWRRHPISCSASAASTPEICSPQRASAAAAVGLGQLEPVVGHVAPDVEQSADELRSRSAVRLPAGDLSAAC